MASSNSSVTFKQSLPGQIPSSTLHILSPGSDRVTDPRTWERTLETSIPNHSERILSTLLPLPIDHVASAGHPVVSVFCEAIIWRKWTHFQRWAAQIVWIQTNLVIHVFTHSFDRCLLNLSESGRFWVGSKDRGQERRCCLCPHGVPSWGERYQRLSKQVTNHTIYNDGKWHEGQVESVVRANHRETDPDWGSVGILIKTLFFFLPSYKWSLGMKVWVRIS